MTTFPRATIVFAAAVLVACVDAAACVIVTASVDAEDCEIVATIGLLGALNTTEANGSIKFAVVVGDEQVGPVLELE